MKYQNLKKEINKLILINEDKNGRQKGERGRGGQGDRGTGGEGERGRRGGGEGERGRRGDGETGRRGDGETGRRGDGERGRGGEYRGIVSRESIEGEYRGRVSRERERESIEEKVGYRVFWGDVDRSLRTSSSISRKSCVQNIYFNIKKKV